MRVTLTTAITILALTAAFNVNASEPSIKQTGISFTENKGQVCDQNFKPRPDVMFSGTSDGMVYHLTNTGISYQLSKIESWKETIEEKTKTKLRAPNVTSIYRIDVKWMGINNNVKIEKGNPLEGEANYYLQQCPNGALNVKSYSDVTYKNIYNGIDLKWYEKNGNLEYDFIVSPNADPGKIKFQINGAKKLRINEKGQLEITTPLGKITEMAPVAYQDGKEIKAKWELKNNELQFNISSYDHNKTLTIDPMVRLWGTYYGGTVGDRIRDVTTDASNNSYVVGFTSSTAAGTIIATSGAFQTSHAGGGGAWDAFIAKFNPSGVRQWATFYGGVGDDYAMANAIDGVATPNLYVTGYSSSSGTVITTAGAHQTTNSGGFDAFLLKFNSATGARVWSTFYGNTNNDYGNDCAVDGANNIIAVGTTSNAPTSTLIATPGSHQSATGANTDGFIVKFNSSGVRQWGSYYGGTTNEFVYGCDVNKTTNDIAFVGYSSGSPTGIVTAGAYQTGGNAFIVKFNQSGVRQWGTYYAGSSDEIFSCAINTAGDVYAVGTDNSPSSNLGSSGSHQSTAGGGTSDAYLVKISSNGATRLWGTYYGGSNADEAMACSLDNTGNIYMTGFTMSTANISSFSSHQTTFGGGAVSDAYIAGFNPSGLLLFGSYYGGTLTDYGWSCKPDGAGNVYLGGSTSENGTTNIISTVGSHQSSYGGGAEDGFLAKFYTCQNLSLSIAGGTTTLCSSSTTLSASGSGFTSYSWSPIGATTSSVLISPTVTTTYTLVANTATTGCVYMDVHTVTAGISPTLTATAATPTACSGAGTSFLSASGASTYSWSTGATTATISVAPSTTTTYTVTGFINACSNSVTVTQTIIPLPTVNITASSNSICAGNSVTLTASGTASTYTWTGGNTNTVIVVSPTVTTNYMLFGSSSGCASSNQKTITVTPSPTVNVTASTASICSGSSTSVTLTATGASTYSWNTGGTTASIAVTPTVTTTYSVVGTNTLGCSRTSTINVTVYNTPTVVVSNYTICPGGTATLSASGATTYSWNTGATTSSILVTPSSNTNYTVTGTSFGTCTNTRTLSVTVGSAISIALTPSPSTICIGNSGTITASGATSYTWNTGSNASSIIITPTTATTYTVAGTSGSCSGTNTISISVSPNPTIAASSSSALICLGNSATLSVTGANSYNWNPGLLTGSSVVVSPTSNTTYTVVGSNSAGCTHTQTLALVVSACTGLNEVQSQITSIVIFPNPNNGDFTISVPEIGNYTIVNSIGQVVETIEVKENSQIISVTSLADGIYYVIGKSAKAKIIVNK